MKIIDFSKFDENYKIKDSKGSINSKHKKHEKTISKHIIIKLLGSSDKEKILKEVRTKRHIICRRTKISLTVDFLLETSRKTNSSPKIPMLLFPKLMNIFLYNDKDTFQMELRFNLEMARLFWFTQEAQSNQINL